MGLYGDKLTLSSGSGVDNLTKNPSFPTDNLDLASGTQIDNLTRSAGAGSDNLTAASGSGEDNLDNQVFTLTTESDTLSTTTINIDVEDASEFPSSGNAVVYRRSDGLEQAFTYSGKTATSLTGCRIESGTFTFNIGDQVSTA